MLTAKRLIAYGNKKKKKKTNGHGPSIIVYE